MKILYISGSFPEPNKGSTIYTDLAEALNEAGHEITVVVYEQSINKKKSEMKKERGFDVLRIVTGNYFNVGLFQKGLTSLIIPILMRMGINKYINNYLIDIILFEAPPVTNAGLIVWAKKKFKCQTYLMLKDIFPQNAVDLGIMKRNGLIFKYFEAMEKKMYKTADTIGCMSLANKQYLIKHNPFIIDKVELFPNTKKLNNSFKPSDKNIMRERYSISNEACVFVFGGNMGKPQYIDLLCATIKQCKNEENIFFLFIGSGTERFKLEQTINNNQIINKKQEQKSGLKIDEYKNKVVEAIEANKDARKLKIKALMLNEIRYISKYDKAWMKNIFLSTENPKLNTGKVKVDWNERDNIYFRLVEEKCVEIYNRVPYQRVTKSAIGTELGIRNMLYNNADKIPNTILFIQNNQESVEDFRIRRLNDIIQYFIETDIPIQLWKVLRLASINSADFMEIRDKLKLPFNLN